MVASINILSKRGAMTIFTFQIAENMLRIALRAMDSHLKTANQELILQISADIVPDGVGCEAFNPKMEVVVREVEEQETKVPKLFYDAFGDSK